MTQCLPLLPLFLRETEATRRPENLLGLGLAEVHHSDYYLDTVPRNRTQCVSCSVSGDDTLRGEVNTKLFHLFVFRHSEPFLQTLVQ